MDPMRMRFISNVIQTTSKLIGWCGYEKAQRLALLVLDSDAQLSVEVGIYGGRSLIPMALACQFKGSGTVIGIDPWAAPAAVEGDNMQGNDEWWQKLDFEWVKKQFTDGVQRSKVENFCQWYQERSVDAVKHFKDSSIDVFHSDGNHSEKVTCAEVEMWMPKMKPNSAWVCDDTDWVSVHKSLRLLESYGYKLTDDFQTWRMYKRSQ